MSSARKLELLVDMVRQNLFSMKEAVIILTHAHTWGFYGDTKEKIQEDMKSVLQAHLKPLPMETVSCALPSSTRRIE